MGAEMMKLLTSLLTAPWGWTEDDSLTPWMKTVLWAIILLVAAAVAYALTLPACAQAIDPDDIPFYCREGSFAHVQCDEQGNIERYHKRSSPYYRPDTGPVYWDRYGYRHQGYREDY